MAVKSYNQMGSYVQPSQSFAFKYLEHGLLCLIAFTGLFCSGFALVDNAQLPMHNFDKKAALFEPTNTMDFDKIILINGNYIKNQALDFKLNLDLIPSKYVLDMGDTKRVILTQENFDYTFEKSGSYLLELKEISRGLITVVASKKITIK
jgi:hypothetical protein